MERWPGERAGRLALHWIILRPRLVHDARLGASDAKHLLCELEHCELTGVANVDRPVEPFARVHHPEHDLDEIVAVAERSGLRPIAVDRNVFPPQRLNDEIADNTSVVPVHARSVGVENADDFYVQVILTLVVKKHRLLPT